MPAISNASPEQWIEIRKASELGVDDETLSTEYGISKLAIKLRRHREKWLTTSRIEKTLQERKALKLEAGLKPIETRSRNALELTVDTLTQRAQDYSLNVFNRASKLAESGLAVLPVPDNWKTFAIADQVARRAAGLDKADSQSVTVNLGGWQAAVTAQGVTAQFREVEVVLADEDCAQEAQDEPEE